MSFRYIMPVHVVANRLVSLALNETGLYLAVLLCNTKDVRIGKCI